MHDLCLCEIFVNFKEFFSLEAPEIHFVRFFALSEQTTRNECQHVYVDCGCIINFVGSIFSKSTQ